MPPAGSKQYLDLRIAYWQSDRVPNRWRRLAAGPPRPAGSPFRNAGGRGRGSGAGVTCKCDYILGLDGFPCALKAAHAFDRSMRALLAVNTMSIQRKCD